MNLKIVILAAGKGTRMRSDLPKVLHPVAGQPMLGHVLDTARSLSNEVPIVVYGHGAELLKEAFSNDDIAWALQSEQLGTGHAVMQAVPLLDSDQRVLILYGDVPLLTAATLQRLLTESAEHGLGVLTARLHDPTGYGRIVRDSQGDVQRIVEHKDATDQERAIDEINTGIMVMPSSALNRWLNSLRNDNAQGEYYLTDVVELAVADGLPVSGIIAGSEIEVAGVNDRVQLAEIERAWQRRNAEALMRHGVRVVDPSRIDVRGELTCDPDVVIDVNVVFEGRVHLARGCYVAPNCVLRDVEIGADSEILEYTSIDQATIGARARIGPFARLRPETDLGDDTRVGNFVEIKKSSLGPGSKVNHLSYVGDATVGRKVNVGAGTITCNYDGAFKHKTVIEDDVFVGSDTQFIAPVTIGKGATIAAGTTVTDDVPAEKLVVSRVRQRVVDGWKRPTKE